MYLISNTKLLTAKATVRTEIAQLCQSLTFTCGQWNRCPMRERTYEQFDQRVIIHVSE